MIFLVRHGETLENNSGLVQGQLQGHLSEAGKKQTVALAAGLKEIIFDQVYTSDLARSRETAKIIVQRLGLDDPLMDSRLREQNFGIYEGKPLFRLLRKLKKDNVHISDFTPDKGENPIDFRNRVKEFYEECLIHKTDRRNVLVITHHGVIRVFLEYVLGLGAITHEIENTSCFKITRNGNGAFQIIK